jgi:outer membrane protein assembly factor BamD
MPQINRAKGARFSNVILTIMVLAMVVTFGGCKNNKNLDDHRSAAELYADAKDSLDRHNWTRAVQEYRTLQVRYPFGRYTEQSMLDLAYAYFKSGQPEGALSTLDRFIRTYPAHPNVDYAFYLKGLVNYEENLGFLERMMPQRIRDRDQTASLEAFADFKELLRRFPDSRFAGDARQRMVFLRNNLAAYEVAVAEYYMRREAFVAVTNRSRYVLENYPGTPQNADALMLLHQAYTELSMPELADDAWAVLQLNYPDHYYVLGEKKPRSWAERLWPFD